MAMMLSLVAATTTPSGAASGPCGPARPIKFNDRITFNAEFGYNDFGDYSLVADVNITVVPGFVVTPGVGWKHTDDGDDRSTTRRQFGGYLRTQFTF